MPWLLLCRVVRVGPLGAQADADEHAAAIDVEAQQQHAAAGEAEEHVAAVDAAAEAQEAEGHAAAGEADDDQQADAEEHAAALDVEAQQQHAAAGEAEEHVAAVDAAAEAQEVEGHAAAGEADDDLQAQLEESIVNLNTDAAASELAHAARDAGAEPDFVVSVAPPLQVSCLIAGLGSHPNAARPDMFPYVIATGRFCLLAHYSIEPSYGTVFGEDPSHSHLVVVRHFCRADGQIASCALPVPRRPPNILALTNVECVGLVCNNAGHYRIAELEITRNCLPTFILFSSALGVWQSTKLTNPLDEDDHLRRWVPHGTVAINSTIFWFDLSWGIISCDLNEPLDLVFHRLPRGRKLRDGTARDLHCRRCIIVSENLLRYVEIILYPFQAATVNMWYRDVENRRWNTNYRASFEDIWADESYAEKGLPLIPPELVGVCPMNSSVVYFSLDKRLFGVNVPEHRVVHCEGYELLNRPGPPDESITSRYLITWNLDADGAINVGHHSDDHSDHGDSSDNGSLDEGEIEYLSHSEHGGSSSSDNGTVGTMEEGEIEYQPQLE